MANFLPKRLTKAEVDSLPIQDGQFIIETDQGLNNKIYIDTEDGERVVVGGGASDSNPTFTGVMVLGADEYGRCGINMSRADYGSYIGKYSVAEGNNTYASGDYSHAEGYVTYAYGDGSHAEGYYATALGLYSHAEGESSNEASRCTNLGDPAFEIEVDWKSQKFSLVKGKGSHTEGRDCLVFGSYSHAEGDKNRVFGSNSHAEGHGTTAEVDFSHTEGYKTIANNLSYVVGIKSYGGHAEGCGTISSGIQHAQGHYNTETTGGHPFSGTEGTAFVIGNGVIDNETSENETRSNAFRVTFAGLTYAKGAYSPTGADYAEYCEWEDGNKDNECRYGYFVTDCGLGEDNTSTIIKKATSKDYIYGIISANPSVIGNGDECWSGQFEKDEWGNYIIEHKKRTIKNEDGTEEECDYSFYKVNPNYDPSKEYIQRADRPEWDAVGMVGILTVRDDGTCVKGGFCCSNDDGIATSCERKQFDCFRVVDRINDNLIKVRIG